MSAPSPEQPMTDEQVAPLLGVSVSTLRHWRGRGEGPPYFKLAGKSVRYRWSEVENWLLGQRVTA